MTQNSLGYRHVQVVLGFLAITLGYVMRINMSVAVVAMTDNKSAKTNYPEYAWDETEKSRILSAFFWGYILPQIVAGNFAEKYGSKPLLFFSMSICSVITLIHPFLAGYGYFVVCILRILAGLAQGLLFPCCTVLLSKWIPPTERAKSFAVTFSGSHVGPLIGFPLSGFLASSKGGWPSIFYVTGGLGCLWVILWYWFGASTPADHKVISEDERTHIETSLKEVLSENTATKQPTPWKEILTSLPVYAILIAHLGQNWGFWMLATQIPNYINAVLGVDISKNGIISSLPYLAGWISAILFSWIADCVNKRGLLPKTLHRNLWNSISAWGPALSLFILAFIKPHDLNLVVTLLILTVAMNSGSYTGFLSNHIELSANYCGTLMGITNSLSTVSSMMAPLSVGWLVKDDVKHLDEQWAKVFYLASSIMFGGNLFYVLFSSSEKQSWNDPTKNDRDQSGKLIDR